MFSVDVVPLVVAGFGVTVRPCGAPLTVKFTALMKLLRASVTVALPLPPCGTVSAVGSTAIEKLGVVELNVAMVFGWPAATVTLQVVAAPEQPPDHPAKALPAAAAAVSVTVVPEVNVVDDMSTRS